MAKYTLTSLPSETVNNATPIPTTAAKYTLTSLPEQQVFMEQPQETTGQAVTRNIARLGARGFESLAGLPGDIAQAGTNLLNLGLTPESQITNKLPLPTSETVKEKVTKPLGGEYLEPRGKGESFLDNVVSDLIPAFLPVKGKIPFKKTIIASGLGNLASWGAEELKLPQNIQSGAKLGTMFLASLGGFPKLYNVMTNFYTKAREAIPENAKLSTASLEKYLNKIDKISTTGLSTPAKEELASLSKNIRSKIKNGKIPLEEVWQINQDINDIGYAKEMKGIRKLIPQLGSEVNKVVKTSSYSYPEFYKNMEAGNNIHAALNNSSAIKKYLNKYVKPENFVSPLTGIALGYYPKQTLGSIAGLFGAKEAANFIEPILKSNVVRKLYKDVAVNALKGSLGPTIKDVNKLDRYFAKEFPQFNSTPNITEQ